MNYIKSQTPIVPISFSKGGVEKKRKAKEKAREELEAYNKRKKDGITEKQWFCLCIEDDQAWWTRSIVFGMSGKFMFVGYCLLCIAFAVIKYMHIRVTFNFLIGSWIVFRRF